MVYFFDRAEGKYTFILKRRVEADEPLRSFSARHGESTCIATIIGELKLALCTPTRRPSQFKFSVSKKIKLSTLCAGKYTVIMGRALGHLNYRDLLREIQSVENKAGRGRVGLSELLPLSILAEAS